ncbi:rRNA small subunit methyltransferase B [Nakamurella antarctica]|uniref:rRNA small subunit methyltransferase B n=1 Tax=Nakamurella antarctica TaxID=1902245 RepID=A0A3G8ZST1_9ACTN|nr:transcription antitermination factor NusB [Nakamurella antarctica]AZI57554.1 rRNA small subunit methyltransferase B [Nakamurella antarctica]
MSRPIGPARKGSTRPPQRPSTQQPPTPDPARQAALDLLRAVREDGAYANLALPKILNDRRIYGRDAGLATELAYGTCRAMGLLDAILAQGSGRPLAELDGAVHDALRLGAYQLLRTRIPAHAAVSATVNLVRTGPKPGAAGFVNAVLRRVSEREEGEWVDLLAPPIATDPIGHYAMQTAHPRWIAEAINDALGAESDELLEALTADDQRPQVHLVARPGRISVADLVIESVGELARYSPYGVYLPDGDPGRLRAVATGLAGVQDEGSQLVALALINAEIEGPDSRWLDLAAGPGGKAAVIGALAAERGAQVDAIEITPHRAELVRQAVAGLPVKVHVADGRSTTLPPETYDRVLLDAPCTGLGALRRRPEARWRRSPASVAELVELQTELLISAAALVRPGGLIGYVTCSPHLAETADIVAARPAGLDLVDARPYLPGVPKLGAGPTVQLWPHRQGTDAMFLAIMRKSVR